MRRAALLLLLALATALPGCGEDGRIEASDLLVRLTAMPTTLRPGQATTLTVTRIWRADHEPAPWDENALAPLILRDERIERREDGRRVQETRRYRAYVFKLEDASVPALVFASRPRDGGAVRFARSEPLALTVVPELDPEHPGPPELPGDAPAGPPPAWTWILGLLALVAGFELVAAARRRRQARADAARRAAPGAALDALGAHPLDTPGQRTALMAALLDAVRDHLALTGAVPARQRTNEEILAALLEADASAYGELARPVDLARFAGRDVSREGAEEALARARAFVRTGRGELTP